MLAVGLWPPHPVVAARQWRRPLAMAHLAAEALTVVPPVPEGPGKLQKERSPTSPKASAKAGSMAEAASSSTADSSLSSSNDNAPADAGNDEVAAFVNRPQAT
jgi:hypothetical protein